MEVRSNGFGSFSGQFVLPSPCLTGYFSLRAADTSVSFKVEEVLQIVENDAKVEETAIQASEETGQAVEVKYVPVEVRCV